MSRSTGASLIRPRSKGEALCAHGPASGGLLSALICGPGRIKRRSTHLMQPIAGIHIGSSMDRRRFDEELYHEDWSGPLETARGSKNKVVP
jgi:hypothetical protein